MFLIKFFVILSFIIFLNSFDSLLKLPDLPESHFELRGIDGTTCIRHALAVIPSAATSAPRLSIPVVECTLNIGFTFND